LKVSEFGFDLVCGKGDQHRPRRSQQQPSEQQRPAADAVGGATERQRDDQDRERVGAEGEPELGLGGACAALDLGQQRGDQPEQRRIEGDRPDRDREDRPAPPGTQRAVPMVSTNCDPSRY